MDKKLIVPVAVFALVVITGVILYLIFSDDASNPETNAPVADMDDAPKPDRVTPVELDPTEFDPNQVQPDPVKTDRPGEKFTPPAETKQFVVSGRVIDETGAGVSDARVTFVGEQSLRDYAGVGYSDAAGFYRLVAWAPNPGGTRATDPYGRVVAKSRDGGLGATKSMPVDPAAEAAMPDLEIRAGGVIEGRVLTEQGEPAPGAEVTLRSSGAVEVITTRGRSPQLARRQYVETVYADAGGAYRADNLPYAEYRVNCTAGYLGRVDGGAPVDLSNGGEVWHEIRLPNAPSIRGVVVDQFDEPVSGAVVRLSEVSDDEEKDGEKDPDKNEIGVARDSSRSFGDTVRRFDEAGRSNRRQMTDANGRFGFHGVRDSSWLLVTRVGESEARANEVTPSSSDYSLEVVVETFVGGIVRDVQTGLVIETFDVRVVRGETPAPTPFQTVARDGKFRIHPGGKYSIANPVIGDVQIRVSAPGYAPQFLKAGELRKGDQRRALDISLNPLCDLTIDLIHDGRKIDLAPVALTFDDRLAFASSSNELGRARIPEVTPAKYRVKVVLPNGDALEGTVDVPPQSQATLEVELKPGS